MSRIIGIDHPALAAEDVDRLSDWYCDVLGYEKVVRKLSGIGAQIERVSE